MAPRPSTISSTILRSRNRGSMLHLLEYASTGADSVGSVDSSRRTLVQPEPFANSHHGPMTALRKRGGHTAWGGGPDRPPEPAMAWTEAGSSATASASRRAPYILERPRLPGWRGGVIANRAV